MVLLTGHPSQEELATSYMVNGQGPDDCEAKAADGHTPIDNKLGCAVGDTNGLQNEFEVV
jgi:hypothetical protein